jgi:PAS domain S-box-containing protein
MAICGQVSQAVALGLALSRQRESEDRFRRLAENSQDVIYRLRLRPRPVYEYVSPAVMAISGYSPEECYADPELHLRLIHPDDRPEFEAAAAGREPTEPLLLRFRHRDGHIVWIESRYTLVRDRAGEIVAMEGVARDITERKAAEAERERLLEAEQEARRQAEAATRARGEFMSIAAHELRTPVASLQGYAQVTLREIEKSGSVNPARLAKSMQQIDAQSKRLTTLIERLLDLSRLEAGKVVLTRQEVDLSAVVESLANAIRHSHPGREIELDCGQTVCASVDSSRLEQIITNLIDNALKFSPPESTVLIEVATDGPGWATIAVRDHGIGIPEDKRSHVFEQFFQAHGQHGGLGIGLYVSRQIAEMHGGTIHLEVPEGGGSRFVVRLPVVQCDGSDGANSSLAKV